MRRNRILFLLPALLFGLISCSSDKSTGATSVASLNFVQQPATSTAGAPVTVSVELLDSDGARVTTATDQVTLSFSGGGVLGGTTTVAAIAGVATFSGITMSAAGQNVRLTARVGNITTTSNTFNVTPGGVSATQSTMAVNPGNPSSNANISLTFVLKDAFGNAIPNAPITFSTSATGVTFTPANTTTDANGAASTTMRALNAGSVSIAVNVSGVSATFGTPISIIAGAASLRLINQPTLVTVDQPFTMSVELLNSDGQRMTSATNPVTLTLSGGTLLGTTTASAVAGLASFNGLRIGTAGTGLRITATSGAVSAQSGPISAILPCNSGTMTIGVPVNATVTTSSGCTLNNHPAASFRFTVPNGNAIVVAMGATSVGGGLTPEVAISGDPAVPDAVVVTQPSREWLLAPGNYLATVSATTGATGNFTVNTTNNGAGGAGCVVRILPNVNATYVGQALSNSTPSECTDLNSTGGYYEDRYLIYDTRPCTITMGAGFDAYLVLRDLNLGVLKEDDDSGGDRDAQLTLTSCRNGSNAVIVSATSFIDFDTGPYTLIVSFANSEPGQPSQIALAPSSIPVTTMQDVFPRRKQR